MSAKPPAQLLSSLPHRPPQTVFFFFTASHLHLPSPPAPLAFIFDSQSSFPHPRVNNYVPVYLLYPSVPSVHNHTESHSFLLRCLYQTSASYSQLLSASSNYPLVVLPYTFYTSNLSKNFISKSHEHNQCSYYCISRRSSPRNGFSRLKV